MIPITKGFGASNQTPVSNTGLNSQSLDDAQLTVKIDWLQLSTVHASLEDFQAMLKYLEDIFSDQIVWYSDRPLYRGRRWDTSGSSSRGIQVCFDYPGEVEPGKGWLLISGGLLSQIDAPTVHDLCATLQTLWLAVARRLDVAIDDYSKPFDFRLIYDQARAGNVALVRKTSVAYHASAKGKDGLEGESVVLGSPQSDKRLTFYNKAVESDGATDSHRVEVRLRDYKADQVFQQLADWSPQDFLDKGPLYLAGVVTGAVEFVDRSSGDRNLKRLPLLDWWSDFLIRVGSSGLRLAAKKREHSMERKISWLMKDVAPSLAMLKRVLGQFSFREFCETLVTSGDSRLSKAQEKLIKVFLYDWYEVDSYRGSIHEFV